MVSSTGYFGLLTNRKINRRHDVCAICFTSRFSIWELTISFGHCFPVVFLFRFGRYGYLYPTMMLRRLLRMTRRSLTYRRRNSVMRYHFTIIIGRIFRREERCMDVWNNVANFRCFLGILLTCGAITLDRFLRGRLNNFIRGHARGNAIRAIFQVLKLPCTNCLLGVRFGQAIRVDVRYQE